MFYVLMQAGNTQAKPNILASLFPFLLIFLIFYFLLIRPQRKKQKDHQKMIDDLKIHDDVITTGGIVGRIVNIKKDKNTVVLRVDETTNAKIEFQRGAISGVLNEEKKG